MWPSSRRPRDQAAVRVALAVIAAAAGLTLFREWRRRRLSSLRIEAALAALRAALPGDLPLVDVRAADSYAARHIRGATSLPLIDLASRTGELPPPPCDVALVAAPGETETALAQIGGGDGKWKVVHVLEATGELWRAAAELDVLERGTASRRLWEPSPHLPPVISQIEEALRARGALRALDLGCGRGRDCVWLAARGWHVVGLDNQPFFLRHLAAFAARHGLDRLVTPLRCDLRADLGGAALGEVLGEAAGGEAGAAAGAAAGEGGAGWGALGLVVVSRFMHRSVLDRVVRAMPPGSFLAVHHFLEGATSLKSGRQIKPGLADERSLAPFELSRRRDASPAPPPSVRPPESPRSQLSYASSLPHVLLDEPCASADGRPMWSYVASKAVGGATGGAAERSEDGGASRYECSGYKCSGRSSGGVSGGLGADGQGSGELGRSGHSSAPTGPGAGASARRGKRLALHIDVEAPESVAVRLTWL